MNCHAKAHQTHLPILGFHSILSSQQLCASRTIPHAIASIYARVNTLPTEWRAFMLRIKRGPAVTGLPLSGLVRVQPRKLCDKNNVCGEGFESLTPLHKRTETLWRGKAVISKTQELSAGNMAPLFTSSRLETVMLNIIIWTSSRSWVNLGWYGLVS